MAPCSRPLALLSAVFVVTLAVVAGCDAADVEPAPPTAPTVATATAGPQRATVADLSVALEASEADALRPHGFMGQGAFGRLDRGCSVDVLRVTDRAALVDVSRCQTIDGELPTKGLQGWVPRSALNISN